MIKNYFAWLVGLIFALGNDLRSRSRILNRSGFLKKVKLVIDRFVSFWQGYFKWLFVFPPLAFLGRHLRFAYIHSRYFRPLRYLIEAIGHLFFPPEGSLPWGHLVRISAKNLTRNRSRSLVTVGGMAVGVGAIVLLVSFAYGLQGIVTKRIIWPDALRVAEVSSESTTIKIDKEMLSQLLQVNKVEQVAPATRLAGQVDFSGSKIDVVVVGATNDYLRLSNVQLLLGNRFTDEADQRYAGLVPDVQALIDSETEGQVAGMSDEMVLIEVGDSIGEETITFRLRDDTYSPLYFRPKATAQTIGFARGTITKTYQGTFVWGSPYDDQSGQGRVVGPDGKTWGKWLKTTLPLMERLEEGTYQTMTDEAGSQKQAEGYLSLADVKLLSDLEKEVVSLLEDETEEGVVMGTTAAQLEELIEEDAVSEAEAQAAPVLPIRDGGKQILVSQALARAWDKEEKEIVGQTIEIQYLITSSLMPQLNTRLLSDVVAYQVVGVFSDTEKPMVYVPLGDIESMGLINYSSAKVLAASQEDLSEVRTIVQSMGLITRSVADTLGQIDRLFRILRFLLGSFGAIALVVALFGMFNTLTVSLLERTREIGVMKSLGTTNSDVARLFLMETLLMSILGGVLGIVVGLSFGKVVDLLFFQFASKLGMPLFLLPFEFIAFILLLTISVGILTGFYPAKRATRITAMDALRYE